MKHDFGMADLGKTRSNEIFLNQKKYCKDLVCTNSHVFHYHLTYHNCYNLLCMSSGLVIDVRKSKLDSRDDKHYLMRLIILN
ncbi:hypothetical protein CR513_13739, partial [Mucuna pruriens]